MTRNGSKWMMMCAAFVAVFGVLETPAAAQRITEARIQELISEAARQVGTPQQPTQVPAPSAGVTRPVVRLTLDEAVKAALDHNLDIAVQRLNPEVNDIAYASLRAIYRPSLTSTLSTQSTTTPSNSTTSGGTGAGAPVVSGLGNFNGGVAQSVPWGGGSFVANLNNDRVTTVSLNSLYNPRYDTNWSGVYTQPLLRNFAIDANRQQLGIAKINRDMSDVQLRSTITNTLSNVRNAYWDYVFAVQSVDVAQQSLDLAQQLVKDNQTRVEVGTMAPIDVVSAQSQAAAARQNLVVAQSTSHTAEIALKRLLVAGTQDPIWTSTIDPVDRPDFRPEAIDIDAAVRRALNERTDITLAKMTVQENDITLKYLSNQLKPQADFVGTYGLVGIGGTQLVKDPNSLNGVSTTTIPGGYGNALSTLLHTNYPRWTAQVNISYPLGLSSQQASVAKARVQLNQIQAQLKQVELQVATDVTNAVVTARSNAERVQAAQAAREFAQKTLEAEQSKFEVGMSTNYNVIQIQRDLATAQNNELQAILNYRKSLVELDRLQQTTLSSAGITVLSSGGGSTTTRTTTGG
jgi:outer membrane protein